MVRVDTIHKASKSEYGVNGTVGKCRSGGMGVDPEITTRYVF
jgi:hypothetical protein